MTPNNKPITILVTGGHLTPALATMEEIQRVHPEWRLVFVGRNTSLEGQNAPSEEKELVTALGVPFMPLFTGRVKRDIGWQTIISLLKIPVGFFQSFLIVMRVRPTLVLSFGGYIAFPISCAAFLCGIPVITHEQTMNPGLANKLIATIAKKVAVSFSDAKKKFQNGDRVVVTGLPIRSSVLAPPKNDAMDLPKKLPMIFIAGGSTGSVSVNSLIFPILPRLLGRFSIVHQVGKISYAEAEAVRAALPKDVQTRYIPRAYLHADEFSWALHACSLFVGRAGANTVIEVAMTGVPAIWIPLPWAAGNEQWQNAKVLADRGSSRIFEQQAGTSDLLFETIGQAMKDLPALKAHAEKTAKSFPKDGAHALVKLLEDYVTSKNS